MLTLLARSLAGLAFLLAVLAALLFAPARTLDYWQAWAWLSVFAACVVAITAYLAARDRALLERRLHAGPVAETRPVQKLAQAIATVGFLALFVLSALDHRAAWTHVPAALSIACDVLVAAGLGLVALVFRANSHASALVEVHERQPVISTGPYALVRHPMYAGALVMCAATPPALGSLVGLAGLVPLATGIVARLLDEEALLAKDLDGYDAYRARVRWRLLPWLW